MNSGGECGAPRGKEGRCTASGVPREAFQPGDLVFPQISAPRARPSPPVFTLHGNTPVVVWDSVAVDGEEGGCPSSDKHDGLEDDQAAPDLHPDFLTYSVQRVRHYGGGAGRVRAAPRQQAAVRRPGSGANRRRGADRTGGRDRGRSPTNTGSPTRGAVSLVRPPREGRPRPRKTPPQLPHPPKACDLLPTTSSSHPASSHLHLHARPRHGGGRSASPRRLRLRRGGSLPAAAPGAGGLASLGAGAVPALTGGGGGAGRGRTTTGKLTRRAPYFTLVLPLSSRRRNSPNSRSSPSPPTPQARPP